MKKILLTLLIACIGVSVIFAQSVKKYYKTGMEFVEAQNYTEAISHFSKAIELKPDYDKAYLERAKAYEKTGNISAAAEDFERLTILTPKDADVFYNTGRLFYKLGKHEEALKKLSVVQDLTRKHLKASQVKIKIMTELGMYDQALEECAIAIRISRRNAKSYYYQGFVYDSLKNYQEAELSYRDAIKLQPNYSVPYMSLAKLLTKLKRTDEALNHINKAISLNDKEPNAFFIRAEIYKQRLDYPNAIDDISKITLLAPKNEKAFLTRGKYYAQFNQHQNAINDFTKALNLNQNNCKAYLYRAHSYEETSAFNKAIKDYEKIIKISGTDEKVKDFMANAQKRLYELNRESDAPQIVVLKPALKDNNTIEVPLNAETITISGQVNDKSSIKYIKINGKDVEYDKSSGASNHKFTEKVDIADAEDITISSSDIYDNVKNANFKIKRTEMNPPIVKLISPYASDNNEIFLDTNSPNLYVEGKIEDESLIKTIFINGAIASFVPGNLNPQFSANINVLNKTNITVKAEDIYGNLTEQDFTLNRSAANILEDNPMGRTWVVFIENSSYQTFASLDGPTKDVSLMKAALADYRINNIIHKKDMKKQEMEKFFAIELRDLVRSNKVNSIIVWYAGHGKFINKTGYWIPIDAKRDDEFTYFSINTLKASMQAYSSYITHTLVITDACESGPSFYQAMRSSMNTERSCSDVNATRFKSSQVLSSAGYELAIDNSQFTKTFANSLKFNKNSCIPIESIVMKVTSAVKQNNKQSPKFGKIQGLEDEDGTFFFIKKQ